MCSSKWHSLLYQKRQKIRSRFKSIEFWYLSKLLSTLSYNEKESISKLHCSKKLLGENNLSITSLSITTWSITTWVNNTLCKKQLMSIKTCRKKPWYLGKCYNSHSENRYRLYLKTVKIFKKIHPHIETDSLKQIVGGRWRDFCFAQPLVWRNLGRYSRSCPENKKDTHTRTHTKMAKNR